MPTIIRKAKYRYISAVYELVKELAAYENAPLEVTASLDLYHECFEQNIFECIVAIHEGEIIGTCIYYMTFSTWKGRMLYLEDFVVKEKYRKSGIGQLLFEQFLEIAQDKNCALVKWQVLDWNLPAIRFYEKNKAKFEKDWWNVKIIF